MTKYPDLSNLSTGELLALTLRENPNTLLIKKLNAEFPSLKDLTFATIPELIKIKGIGPKKATSLLASIELAKRLNAPTEEIKQIHGPQDVANLVGPEMRYLDREHFR